MSPKSQQCLNILISISKNKSTITYGDLAKQIGVAAQGIGRFLNEIYDDITINQQLPDITLLAVYSKKTYGLYNSAGRIAQSIVFDPNDPVQMAQYLSDRQKVYTQWP
ncbi:hypothetical protein G3485_22155 [Shewanella baltica]|uniref:hypothetical protein n=1 Tax=Shewanella baltica TaxID=62322 RepID=UPI00217CDAC8|nr:hypothetical protein [Shewanella baltica]MCS6129788.1 hypothetical protein [Shewanella baltica]MCS6141728.1 hypothetical protein [Shewanella baltica]MCS6148062.1 hypothetical protein [Shewanella baltica]MCS6172591.1 hypothetical protein [Shewanella baltica]MCS6189815.1 hypothetical protein [Shewanella baltica]